MKIDNQVSQFLERILDASVPSVIGAYEERIQKLEMDKRIIKEKAAESGKPANTFDDALRTAFEFLSNPLNLWGSERLEDRHAVLKLAFCDRLEYSREKGFRTANFTMPFKVLGSFMSGETVMVRPGRFEQRS